MNQTDPHDLNPEWGILEAILDKHDTPVEDMMGLIGANVRVGRSMGLLIVVTIERIGEGSWRKVKRCRISSAVRFRAWIKANRPELELKLQAVEVDRSLSDSSPDWGAVLGRAL